MTSRERFDQLYASDDPLDRAEIVRRAATDPEWARWLEIEQRIDRAARSIPLPTLPDDLWQRIRARASDPRPIEDEREAIAIQALPAIPSRRVRVWRLAAAAAIWVGVLGLLWNSLRTAAVRPTPAGLLSSGELAIAERQQRERESESASLLARASSAPAPLSQAQPEEWEAAAAHAELLAMLEAALAECEEALALNPQHRHLRLKLEDLSRRKLELLRERLPERHG